MRSDEVLTRTPQGLYCPPADAYIDPLRPVPRAIVTHGHSDHARPGHDAVLATAETLAIMAARYGEGFCLTRQIAGYGEMLRLKDAAVTLFPAGHILGSAQVLIEAGGRRLVVSGDYKRQRDPTATAYECVRCDAFVSEATFGLPVFRHPDPGGEIARLLDSMRLFPERPHLVGAYSLGKAQRVIAMVREAGYRDVIHLHNALGELCALYERFGIALGPLAGISGDARRDADGGLILCPPGAVSDVWARRFNDPVTAVASGWMRVRARARQAGAELPLVISDHADWDDLCRSIIETGASELWVTHGQEDALVHWASSRGLAAKPLRLLGYGDEDEVERGKVE